MEEAGEIEIVDPKERRGGAGEEDAQLVEKVVEGVKFAVGCEGWIVRMGFADGKEESGADALVDGVFGDVD